MRRVAFYSGGGYHEVVLRPVADALAPRLEVLVSRQPSAIVAFRPDILVLASHRRLEWFRRKLPTARIGSVRHGLIAKRGLTRRPRRDSARRFDFLCVGDAATLERYRAAEAEPTETWWTGYPQMDPLFRHDEPPRMGLAGDAPVVLYAPTWNPGMSSAPMLGDRLGELLRGDGGPLDILVKPHPVIPHWRPAWMGWWQAAADRDPRIRLLDPRSDVTGPMLAADLLVSDASSVIFEFLARDRPIVLLTNPAAATDNDYDPADLPWRWRDVGDEVTDPDQLANTVRAALADPGARRPERARAAEQLFGRFRDGRNAARAADHLVDLANRIDAGIAPAPIPFHRRRPASRRRPVERVIHRLLLAIGLRQARGRRQVQRDGASGVAPRTGDPSSAPE